MHSCTTITDRSLVRAFPAYILAGGRSSRFGSDKARASLHGRPLILSVADALRPIASRLTVVADKADKYSDLSLDTIADRQPGFGPMSGLHASVCDRLDRDGEGWLLLSACDVAGIKIEWIDQLAAHIDAGVDAVAFRGAHWEPLLALYHTSVSSALQLCIKERELAMWQLLARLRVVAVPTPDDWQSMSHINQRRDLLDHQACERKKPSV